MSPPLPVVEPIAADATLIDAVQIAFILIAVERGSVSKEHACNVLGMTSAQYTDWRRQAVSLGRGFADTLATARRSAA